MAADTFDAIVIGAGQAGPSLAARCSQQGLRVALVERDRLGRTCVNTGCYPTKTLVASARAMHLARRGAEFGFDCGPVQVDVGRAKARKDEIVGAERVSLEAWIRGMKGVEWITGHARFVGPGQVHAAERLLTAPKIFLNVGTRPAHPPLEGIDDVPTLDNASALELEEVPREDEEIAAEVRAILGAEGVRFRLGAECIVFVKALVDDDSRRMLGAAILGLNRDEVVHNLLYSMTPGVPASTLVNSVPIHPTVSELLPTLLQQLKPLA
jgi:pyruvate/2-oxoglutarate dehydrogenase complex dihydrolipoamide dehydrogenase (E3) component